MEGVGFIEFKNGDTYTGEFGNDMFHGQGAYTYKDGRIFSG